MRTSLVKALPRNLILTYQTRIMPRTGAHQLTIHMIRETGTISTSTQFLTVTMLMVLSYVIQTKFAKSPTIGRPGCFTIKQSSNSAVLRIDQARNMKSTKIFSCQPSRMQVKNQIECIASSSESKRFRNDSFGLMVSLRLRSERVFASRNTQLMGNFPRNGNITRQRKQHKCLRQQTVFATEPCFLKI